MLITARLRCSSNYITIVILLIAKRQEIINIVISIYILRNAALRNAMLPRTMNLGTTSVGGQNKIEAGQDTTDGSHITRLMQPSSIQSTLLRRCRLRYELKL